MNKFILPFLLLLSTPTLAADVVQVPIVVPCGSKQAMTDDLIKKYGEVPMAKGQGGTTFLPSGKYVKGLIRIWANSSSWTFTVTIEDPKQDVMCLLVVGTELSKIIQGDEV